MNISIQEKPIVGIYIKKYDNIFNNGCIMQAYIHYLMLSKSKKFITRLYTNEEDYTTFEYTDTPIHTLNINQPDRELHSLLFISGTIGDKNIQDKLIEQGIRTITLNCGNLPILFQEEFIFNVHKIYNYQSTMASEFWTLPMYKWAKDFFEMIWGIPCSIVPYVWHPYFFQEYQRQKKYNLNVENYIDKMITSVPVHQENGDIPMDTRKVMLCIFQPDMSIHKTSLVPLIIANNYYIQYPDKVAGVYWFTNMSVDNNSSTYPFLQKMEMVRDGKLNKLPKMILSESLHVIFQKVPAIPIVLSHNFYNELNFLHLEAFSIGLPIVHACEPYKESETYYKTEQMKDSIQIIEDIRKNFGLSWIHDYKQKTKPILSRYSADNFINLSIYEKKLGF